MTRLYEAIHKQWDHTGSIVPEVEHGESHKPPAELKPAAWLPVQGYDKKFEAYRVVAAGKVIAVDKQGKAVPAGIRKALEVASGTTALTYAAADVTEKVTDLTTGAAVAAAGSYTQNEVTLALRARGLIAADEYARDFVSRPIGYAPYSFYKWAGGDGFNPAQFTQHNHILQHQVAAGTDYSLIIPMVPAAVATETMGDGSISSSAIAFGTTQWHSATGLNATTRFASLVAATDSIVGYVFAKTPVAKITINTPITDDGSALAAKTEVNSISAVITGGSDYFYIDYSAGVMFLYESGGDAVPTGFTDGTSTVTYYSYEDSATDSQTIAQVIGNARAGDFVTYNSASNFSVWSPDVGTASGAGSGVAYSADPDYAADGDADISAQLEATLFDAMTDVVGQIIAIWEWPRSGLEKVMTQYTSLTAVERMPGTATAGMSDALVQSGGANRMAIINFMAR